MYYFRDNEIADMVDEWSRDRSHTLWWWYRDIMLVAQERGLVKVIAHTEDKPFWWRTFAESIELADKIKELIEKNKQRDNKGV